MLRAISSLSRGPDTELVKPGILTLKIPEADFELSLGCRLCGTVNHNLQRSTFNASVM